ncbi:MAG: TIGR03936 family radical SAM-associated protein [Limnochordia bacterium]|nr:TIGR03936 family radical SAM-associated protein [Limnochordia bacterium]
MSNVIRFQFSKGPEVRFLSHLDLVRTLERAVRRAHLPMAYSEGFTPRPMMSYSYALPVGILSEAEYGDFTFVEELDPKIFVEHYNDHLPQGFRVLRAEQQATSTQALQGEINTALWRVFLPGNSVDAEMIGKRWQYLQNVDSFVIRRETRKGSREVDVRPFVFSVDQIVQTAAGTTFECLCGLGNEANLRMDELGALLCFAHLDALITRIGQFKRVGNSYFPPLGS